MRALSFAIAILAVEGCAETRSVTRGISEPDVMVATIAAEVPAGSPIDDAERFMKSEGFDCNCYVDERLKDEDEVDSFGSDGAAVAPSDRSTLKDVDGNVGYLSCRRTETVSRWPPISQSWMVSIIHHNGAVTEVVAVRGLTGL